ncbi:unnamed protein product [Brassica oleracea]
MAASFEVKHLQENRFTHPLSLSILHLEPFPRRDSNHHCNKISSLKPTGREREVLRYELRCRGERCKVCFFVSLKLRGASLDGLALKLKFSERKWRVTVGKDSENPQQSYM